MAEAKLCNHRHRRRKRQCIDDVRAIPSLEVIEKPGGDFRYARLQLNTAPLCERLCNQRTQMSMPRRVEPQESSARHLIDTPIGIERSLRRKGLGIEDELLDVRVVQHDPRGTALIVIKFAVAAANGSKISRQEWIVCAAAPRCQQSMGLSSSRNSYVGCLALFAPQRGIEMKRQLAALAASLGLGMTLLPTFSQANEDSMNGRVKHVLLISVDGLHALDVANYVKSHPGSAMDELAGHGVTFSNARIPANSDSFPGILALVTGGSPHTHGVFYDYSYDRTIWAPDNKTCSGPSGTQMIFDESIDVYVGGVSQNVIDPNSLPRHLDRSGHCVPMYPHEAVRTNTLFEVIKAQHAGRTAWADKHPAYDLVNGPSGKGVDDLYTPEISNVGGYDNTNSVVCTVKNDALKVKAILNEIKGLDHEGNKYAGVPTVFGMNFQAVSVGQKLLVDNVDGGCSSDKDPAINGRAGGYVNGRGDPSAVLAYGLNETDAALWQMINALKKAGLYDSTLFIVTSKHGQSPINIANLNKPGHFADLVCTVSDCSTNEGAKIISDAGNNCVEGPCGLVQDDDIVLIWLPDQSKTNLVADYLNVNAKALFIDEVMSGADLTLKFRNPLKDSRTPDIIVQPVYGTVYTSPTKNKVAEHGGFSFGDTNVGLIVSNPSLSAQVVKTPVLTSQVAATILKSLRIDPQALESVKLEGISELPFVFEDRHDD